MADVTSTRGRWLTAIGIPDQRLELWEEESSYTAADPIPSVVEPQGGETLQVQATGTPTSTTPLELRTVRGGYTDGGAGFEYRESGGTWLQRAFPTELGSGEIVALGGSVLLAVAADTLPDGRAVVARLEDDQANAIYVSVEQPDGSWSGVFVGFSTSSGAGDGLDITARADGTLDIWTWGDVLRRWRSTDEGATWTEISVGVDGVWSTVGVASGPSLNRDVAVAQSGGRMLLVESRDGQQLASDDGGYTWETVATQGVIVGISVLETLGLPSGFLVSGESNVYYVSGAFSATWVPLTGFPATGQRISFASAEGYYWASSYRSGSAGARASMYLRRSIDGQTWEDVGDNDHHLSTNELVDAVLVAGRGSLRWMSVAPAPSQTELWSHQLGGWSSLGGLTVARNWWMAYTPRAGVLPGTLQTDESSTRGAASVAYDNGGLVASGGVLTMDGNGFEGGVHLRWTPSGGDPDWTVEVDIEVTEGTAGAGATLLVSTDHHIGRAIIDTIGVQLQTGGVDVGTKTAITGRMTVRLQLDQATDSSSARMRCWVRPHGSAAWSVVGGSSSYAMSATGEIGVKTDLRVDSTDTVDVTARVYGWRVRNEYAPHVASPAVWSATPQYLQDGLFARSVHGTTHPGDTWALDVGARYHPDRLLPAYPSPRMGFRSSVTGFQDLAFRVPSGEVASAHLLLLEDIDTWAVRVKVRIAGAWVTYGLESLEGQASLEKIGPRHVRLQASGGLEEPLEYIPAGALVGATVTSTAGAHTVVAHAGGMYGRTVDPTLTQPLILELDSEPAETSNLRLRMPRAAMVLHHESGVIIEGILLEVASTHVPARIGNAIIAPVTWLSEGPDHTATTGLDLMSTIEEEEDGTEHIVQTRPDRRRVELNFARLLPMYAQDAGDFDVLRMAIGADAAATSWTLPQALMGIARTGGRRPVVYLPAVPIDATITAPDIQMLSYTAARQAIHGRLAMASVREEGVLGQHGTADQLVRGSTWTITEVV